MASRWISRELLVGLGASVAVHLLTLLANAGGAREVRDADAGPTEVTIEPAAPASVPPEPERPAEQPRAEEPKAEPRAPVPAQPAAAREQTRPAAAQAGQTLTAPDEGKGSDQPADFTMVQGEGAFFAGGTTAPTGTSTSAVRGPAAAAGTAPPAAERTAAPPSAPAVDRSRPATPVSAAWSCSHLFPSDPDAPNTASVPIVVTVRPDGTPLSVAVVRDPGHGFGAAARTCALSQRYSPALSRDGQPMTATTPPITVTFTR